MAFRWFRKNKNATRWMYILVTVFVMVTFTITGAMLDGLSDTSESDLAGSFVTPGGKTVEVNAHEFRQLSFRMARMFGGRDVGDERTWTTLMMDARAEEAGIVVSDRMLKAYIRQGAAFASDAEFNARLKTIGVTPAEYQALMRQQIRISLYQRLNRNEPRVLSEQIVEQYQKDQELIQLEYVAFSDEEQAAQLDASAVSEAELTKFYEEDLDALRKGRDFSTPELYGLEAALLSVEGSTAEGLREKLPEDQRALTDEEVQSYYDDQIDRFQLDEEQEDAESSTDENGDPNGTGDSTEDNTEEPTDEAEDEHAGHNHAPGEHPEEPEFRPLAEVRELIEKEILVSRVVNVAMINHRELQQAREKAEAEKEVKREAALEAAKAAKAAAAEGGESETAEADPAAGEVEGPEPEPEDLFKTIADKYGLELVDFGEPMDIGAVEQLDRIGSSEIINLVRYQTEGNVVPMGPTAEVAYGYLLRMKQKVVPAPKPFDEVKAELPELWLEVTAQKKSQELADEFALALTAKAKTLVQDEVEAIEKLAREQAAARIEAEAVTEEEAQQKLIESELAGKQQEIDSLVGPRKGDVLVALAEERGVAVRTVDWFRKSSSRTGFFADDEDTAERFLKARRDLFQMNSEGSVSGPLRYEHGKQSLIVRVAARKPPELQDMQLIDQVQARRLVEQQANPAAAFAQFGGRGLADSRFEYGTLADDMQLRILHREAPPAEKPAE